MGAHVRVHNQLAQGRDARVAARMDKVPEAVKEPQQDLATSCRA